MTDIEQTDYVGFADAPKEDTGVNGFRLKHLSGSTINSFITNRGQWYASKVRKAPFKTNPNMCRGKAVEAVINDWIEEGTVGDITTHAYEIYDKELTEWLIEGNKRHGHADWYDKDKDEVRSSIPGLMKIAWETYVDDIFSMFKPITQHRIEINLPGVDIPVIGFLDYYRPQVYVKDCKVVSRSMSKLSQPYCITGALYHMATKCPVYYNLFVDNKKPVHVELKLSDAEFEFGKSYAIAAAKVLRKLEYCEDHKECVELVASFPDLDSMWDKVEKKEAAAEWGIILPE